MTNFAVIGAGFGDEGKGMTTATLMAHFGIDTAVRFNGGAQAGHTTSIDGVRMVNSAFGSGSQYGYRTQYTKDVIYNPIVVDIEQLEKNCEIVVDPECIVSTPYDVLYNRLMMRALGVKNGCGLGINTTIKRNDVIKLTVADCMSRNKLSAIVPQIRDYYIAKANVFGVEVGGFTQNTEMLEHLLYNCVMNSKYLKVEQFACNKPVVFEGAQGLMLDQELGTMPYLTPSYTGLQNIAQYDVAPVYCMRTFATRHGDGPFETRNPFVDQNYEYSDLTNVANPYQGNFRLAPLNITMIRNFIRRDCQRVGYTGPVYISVSHLDVFDNTPVFVVENGALIKISSDDEFLSLFKEFELLVVGYGPNVSDWTVCHPIPY